MFRKFTNEVCKAPNGRLEREGGFSTFLSPFRSL